MRTFQPTGMIPEFNALGKHPHDMDQYFEENVRPAYVRLGIEWKYPEIRELFGQVVDQFAAQPTLFVGHHVPTEVQRKTWKTLVDTFVDVSKCKLHGGDNLKTAIDLANEGHNLLIVQNHTSALDAFISDALIAQAYGRNLPISYVASQVFEYARITAIVTSGVEKFRVFQPKHIRLIQSKDQNHAACEMHHQNGVTLHSLARNARNGGKMVVLYPERNRSATMGVPEPMAMAIASLLEPHSKGGAKELYVLPTNITGRNPVIVNRPGTNELDKFFDSIYIGHGNMYCGRPVQIRAIHEVLRDTDRAELVKTTTGAVPENPKDLSFSALAISMLGMVAHLSPQDLGVYDNDKVRELAAMCQERGLAA